jgi:cobalt-zinc-cadmium efflux system outer membrane protein
LAPQAAPLDDGKPFKPPERLKIPPGLPGADAPRIVLPADPDGRAAAIRKEFPPIEPLPAAPPLAPGPEGRPMTLADLQRLGEEHSPSIKTALAAMNAAQAAAHQAGAYPNPTFAFEHDTAQTGPAGYPGFYLDQVIKTGGKLTVAQASAAMDYLTAKLALRKARSDLHTQIRGYYFAVLVARETVRVNEALFTFTEDIYRYQVAQFKLTAALYELLQLRPTVLQARLAVLQARNQEQASWHQLAAALGLPDMPPTQLEGRVDRAVPSFDLESIKARLAGHTDVLTALVSIQKAKYGLQLAKLIPLPDVDVRVLVQKDYSTPPNQVVNSFQVSIPIPVWDQNRGGIRQAEWLLAQASVAPAQAQNALTINLADAYGRYLTARQTAEVTQAQIRDQVRAYTGLRARRNQDPTAVGFGDQIVAQQALAGYIAAYVAALGQQWQATTDVANFLQVEDIFVASGTFAEVMPVLDITSLMPPPGPVPGPPPPAQPVSGPISLRAGRACPPPQPAPAVAPPMTPGRLNIPELPAPTVPRDTGPVPANGPQVIRIVRPLARPEE